MNTMVSILVKCLDDVAFSETSVIPWSSPVPCFGDISRSTVATLGLNPSNREFVDELGRELDGHRRRFHTLRSLGLSTWAHATAEHLKLIIESCYDYFLRNPYDGWFRKLDEVISDTKTSYYSTSSQACHLDLIPFATACKWGEVPRSQRASLLAVAADALGVMLRESRVRTIVLNGISVVTHFESIAQVKLARSPVREWALSRGSDSHVMGYSYVGTVRRVAGVDLERELLVLGFNHNIQSSFGVRKDVVSAIRRWIGKVSDNRETQ